MIRNSSASREIHWPMVLDWYYVHRRSRCLAHVGLPMSLPCMMGMICLDHRPLRRLTLEPAAADGGCDCGNIGHVFVKAYFQYARGEIGIRGTHSGQRADRGRQSAAAAFSQHVADGKSLRSDYHVTRPHAVAVGA